jgi:multidrug efflux pump subunit AcrB
VQVDLVPARMRALGLDARDVAAAIRDSNRNVSGGYVDAGSRRVFDQRVLVLDFGLSS